MRVAVIGCGDSASEWHDTPHDYSIAVNDGFKWGYHFDALVLANWPIKFPTYRLNIVKESKPKVVYANVDQWSTWFPSMVKIRLRSWDGHLYQERKDEFTCSQTSPIIAMSIAYKMGAKDIILWGVEFIDHGTFNKDNPQTKMELRAYKGMIEAMKKEGVNVYLGAKGSLLEEFVPIWHSDI
jgi:hypothetical protein